MCMYRAAGHVFTFVLICPIVLFKNYIHIIIINKKKIIIKVPDAVGLPLYLSLSSRVSIK